MNGGIAKPVHELDSPWPAFLDFLDRDPRHALEGLHTFAWKLSYARPPAILRSLDPADQQDRISDLVLSCCQNDFRKLRKYHNVGRPFAAWLMVVLDRQVRDWLRSRRPTNELDENLATPSEPPSIGLSARIVRCLNQNLARMSEKCRLYLACLADGMKPREIALLLQMPEGGNKRVSDDLRQCMHRLREMLIADGVTPDEITV
jgi:RNA polymerase sigma factor (sigma-70 family)